MCAWTTTSSRAFKIRKIKSNWVRFGLYSSANASSKLQVNKWENFISRRRHCCIYKRLSLLQWQIAIEAVIVRINQFVHIINLFFLGDIKSGRKAEIFFLIIFFFSFNHDNNSSDKRWENLVMNLSLSSRFLSQGRGRRRK